MITLASLTLRHKKGDSRVTAGDSSRLQLSPAKPFIHAVLRARVIEVTLFLFFRVRETELKTEKTLKSG